MDLNYKINNEQYHIKIKNNIGNEISSKINNLNSDKKIIFLYDINVQKTIIDKIIFKLKISGFSLIISPIEGNKINKNEKLLFKILDNLIENKFTKKSIILSCGGGVVGDVSALAASLYLRGLIYIHIPSTMTSIVDSCIGGKTAINYKYITNSLGTYYHPKFVFIYNELIELIPDREFIAGIPEILKCGLINDKNILIDLKRHNLVIERNKKIINNLIYRSLKTKIKLFRNDVFENNTRLFLNFGHTFAHSIEMTLDSKSKDFFRHGEAVGIGIICELNYASKNKSNKLIQISEEILDLYSLPKKIIIKNKKITQKIVTKIYNNIFLDKKRINDYPRYISLTKLNKPSIKEIRDLDLMLQVINKMIT